MSLMLQRQSLFSSHTGHVMAGVISRKHICSFFLYTYLYFNFLLCFPSFLCFCWRSNEGFHFVICVAVAGIRWDTSLISTSMDAFMKGASRLLFLPPLRCSILLLIFLFS
ncbi:hypothetical protein HDV62DRAFT_368983 [Trichoderma sp. SZMC 28011]